MPMHKTWLKPYTTTYSSPLRKAEIKYKHNARGIHNIEYIAREISELTGEVVDKPVIRQNILPSPNHKIPDVFATP